MMFLLVKYDNSLSNSYFVSFVYISSFLLQSIKDRDVDLLSIKFHKVA